MNLLKLLFYIKSISLLVITFCNCYKFSCNYRTSVIGKCYLSLSVKEESFEDVFLCLIPKELRKRVKKSVANGKSNSVGLLTSTNVLLYKSLSKINLLCIATAFNYLPKDFRVIRLFKNEKAVKNYKRMDDVDNRGKRIRNRKGAYLKNNWTYFKGIIKKNRSFMKIMNCPVSCSKFK